MAKTITQLPDATTVGESDEMIVQQSGITKRASIAELKAQVATLGARDITVSGAARSITNTGNFALSFGTNNTERVRIDNGGNVLIGTNNSTLGKLQVEGGRSIFAALSEPYSVGAKFSAAGGAVYFGAASASATPDVVISASGGTELMRLTDSGNVGIGTASPNGAAVLDVSSTTRGFLPPRMTTTQRNAITTPPAGLMVYNTTTNKLNFYNGTAWEAVTSA